MFQNVERYVKFITDNNLTQSQFLMLYLLYRKKYECIKLYKEKVPTEDGSMIGKSLNQDLIDRGFLEALSKEEGKEQKYKLTEKFTRLFIKDVHEAARQFWDKYPGFVNIGGRNIPLTTMDQFRFANIYGERIDYSVEEHLEVLKDIEFGVNKNLISCSIEKFVMSENWMKIRQIRLNQDTIAKVEKLDEDF